MTTESKFLPANVDITLWTGDTYTQEIYIKSNNVAVDLTNYTAALTIYSLTNRASVLALTSPSNGIVITAATGLITVTITANQSASLRDAEYAYELELTVSSTVRTYMAGRLITTSNPVQA